jgi:hypothetical protein
MIRARVATIIAIVSIWILLIAKAQAHPAWGIVVDRQSEVYFSDLKTIWKIDAQGRLSVFRAADDRHTHELNIDEAGNVYGVDDFYRPATQRFFDAIWKMTPAGDFSYVFAPTENPPKGLSIWRDRDGNMYSVEQNNHVKRETLLLKRTPGGKVSVLAGSSYGHADGKGSQAKFGSIVGMAFGPDGSLYLTDSASVRTVTMDGMVTTLARNIMVESASGNQEGGASPTTWFGIAVGVQGNAFVADHGNRRILKIAPDGQMSTLIRSEESWFPTGVAVRGGELYILEESHTPASRPLGTRVRKLFPDGRVTVLATVGEGGVPSGSSSAGETSFGGSSERIVEPKQNAPYALFGAGIGVFALTFVVWRIWRRIYLPSAQK